MGVGGGGGSWLAGLGSNTATSDVVDIDSAIREEKERAQQAEELEQDRRMLLLLEEQERGLVAEISRRVHALNHEDEGGQGGGGGGGSGGGGGGAAGEQQTEEAIQTMAEAIDDAAGPSELMAGEEVFMDGEVQETETEQTECIYPQPEGRASRAVRESTEKAREEHQQRQREGRWVGIGASDDDDSDGSDNWEQDLMSVEIDQENQAGELREEGQRQRYRTIAAARSSSGGAFLADRMGAGSSAAQEAEREAIRRSAVKLGRW